MEAVGYNGQINFDGTQVTITRRGFVGRVAVGSGGKHIPVASIGAVEWKPAGFGVRGFIHFAVVGSVSTRGARRARTGRQTQDEDAVVFNRHQQPEFEEIRAAIEHAMHSAKTGAPQSRRPADTQDRLVRLQQLLQQGLINQQEYDAKRAEILGDL